MVSDIQPGQDFQTQGHYGQGQRSNQGPTMTFHTYQPQPITEPIFNLLYFVVSEIQPGQTFSRRPPICPPSYPSRYHG